MNKFVFCLTGLIALTASWPGRAAAEDGAHRFTDIRLLAHNEDAWHAKHQLITQAQRSLELSYFILEDDETTSRLMLDLVAAAGRNVKVRLLVDHAMTHRQAPALRTLAGIPNIEVRRYRPPAAEWLAALQAAGIDRQLFLDGLTTGDTDMLGKALKRSSILPSPLMAAIRALRAEPGERRFAFAPRLYEALIRSCPDDSPSCGAGKGQWPPGQAEAARRQTSFSLIGKIARGLEEHLHRHHHKLLLADNRCFIMGGRNLADAYQREKPPQGHAFQDTDIHACDTLAGDSEHRAGFEALWHHPQSVDIRQADPLDQRPALPLASLQAKAALVEPLMAQARSRPVHTLPGMDGYIINNLPGRQGDRAITDAYAGRIREFTARRAGGSIDIVSAYVFLGDEDPGSTALEELTQSLLAAARAGIPVNIYTNSRKSTDLQAINVAAYKPLSRLIEGGIKVFELKPGQGCLHTKAAAIGNDWLMIGSYNMDPRSELYDTNNLIVLRDSKGIATSAFRQARIKELAWKPLTAASAKRLAGLTKMRSARIRLFADGL